MFIRKQRMSGQKDLEPDNKRATGNKNLTGRSFKYKLY